MAEGGLVSDDINSELNASISMIECAVCLQTCVHPAELPCGHIFCFLCIKGIAFQSGRCAMCRKAIPEDFLYKPKLLTPLNADSVTDTYHWYYEGGSGWWQYDQRASVEIEESYQRGDKACNLLLAGFLYVIDFNNMMQYRQTNPVRRRRIKRDRSTTDKLGVAGLTETVFKTRMEEVELGLQHLWPSSEDSLEPTSNNRTVQPGAEVTSPAQLTRHDSEQYGLESLGPEEYPSVLDYRVVSPSQRDGRCFNPRLDLGESGDEESEEEEEDEPRRIMSGPSAASPAAFRPQPLRALGQEPQPDLDSIENN